MGLNEYKPHRLAGHKRESLVSVPMETGLYPAATAVIEPEDDPGGIWPGQLRQSMNKTFDHSSTRCDCLASHPAVRLLSRMGTGFVLQRRTSHPEDLCLYTVIVCTLSDDPVDLYMTFDNPRTINQTACLDRSYTEAGISKHDHFRFDKLCRHSAAFMMFILQSKLVVLAGT